MIMFGEEHGINMSASRLLFWKAAKILKKPKLDSHMTRKKFMSY